ncbi:hypothetical protein WUBG_08947, partial [Wuchereria bancrofti]
TSKLMEEENSLSLSGRESSVIEVEELQQSSSEWCIDSEIRLFKKLLSHKPA